jgi:hypothetical protein
LYILLPIYSLSIHFVRNYLFLSPCSCDFINSFGISCNYKYFQIWFLKICRLNLRPYVAVSRSQWPCGLRRRSSAARLLRSLVRIPPEAWTFVCCECCVLSDRGLCDGLITRPEKSYRPWRVVVCDQEASKTRRLKPATGLGKIQPDGL